jgi:hypothetical protein
MSDKPMNYPYAFGRLEAGIDCFATSFAIEASSKGYDIDWDLISFMELKLKEMRADAIVKAKEYEEEYSHLM